MIRVCDCVATKNPICIIRENVDSCRLCFDEEILLILLKIQQYQRKYLQEWINFIIEDSTRLLEYNLTPKYATDQLSPLLV